MTLEIAVQDVDGAIIALEEGADRIELCMALGATGGVTPSFGLIQSCAHVGVPQGVQALIRPRGGAFVFDAGELHVMAVDVRSAILAGASGVVIGALKPDGTIDVAAAEQLADEARAEAERCNRRVQITFHRAFDVVPDQFAALDTLIELGYTRVLTSGGEPTAPQALDRLCDLVAHAAGRIQIEAGGGVTIPSIPALRATGVDAVHMSAKTTIPSPGGPGGGGADARIEKTDRSAVRAAVAAMR
ncbi:copper homeostasis protein CutC [Bifidobacterium biavatii]|uniref:PF03932 family protein CutC n=1 Tax=Bifidobacterium biavatii DSM 23969 TaxID=1437608 RepID=A0A086ZSH3_9BIFI|nr:copper homeostasis protein CutC [Bifidobacterium biavatii]KFI49473.1 copper homeostasis protein [Bifidobacterium biavatii DSM 23969]